MDAPLISIVTTVKNGAATLPATLASITGQTFTDYEYIVIDAASADGTQDLIGSSPVVTRWVSEPDDGIFDAMNKGARMARGRWLYFLGADDTLCRDALAAVAPRLTDPDTVYYGDVVLASDGRRYDGPFGPRKLAVRNICHQAVFYPRAAFERYTYNLRYPVLADWVMNMQCFADPGLRNRHLPLVIARYDDRAGCSARSADPNFVRDYPELLRRYFPRRISAWHATLRLGVWSS